MKIFIEKENKHIVLDKKCTVEELLSELKINPETAIVTKNDEVALSDEMLSEKDEVKILSVISGG
jgi:sulfur carrier protein ThiS